MHSLVLVLDPGGVGAIDADFLARTDTDARSLLEAVWVENPEAGSVTVWMNADEPWFDTVEFLASLSYGERLGWIDRVVVYGRPSSVAVLKKMLDPVVQVDTQSF